MTSFKFGCLPGKIPVGLRELSFYAPGGLPAAPGTVTPPTLPVQADGTPWGVLGNADYGDCGPAGLDHGFMCDASVTEETESFPTQDEVVQYYLAYTGGQDTGVVLSDYLAYVKATGFYGHTVSAYAPVGVHDIPSLHFAVSAYGFAYTGIRVTQGMMNAFNDGQPWGLRELMSETEGGHCVPVVGYDDTYLYAVTWGKIQPVSYAAWHYMSSEAWAVITGELVSANGARGVNLAALQADLVKVGRLCRIS